MLELEIPLVPSTFLKRLPSILKHPSLGDLRSVIPIKAGYLAHYWTGGQPLDYDAACKVCVAIEHVAEQTTKGYIEIIGYERGEAKSSAILVKLSEEAEPVLDKELESATYIESPDQDIKTALDFPSNIKKDINSYKETEDLSVDLLSPTARIDAQTFFDSLETNPDHLHALLDELTVHCPASCN